MDNHVWNKALILRGCPPADILYGPAEGPLLAHLDVCPACREHLTINVEEREEWAAMGRALQAGPPPAPRNIAPGQVWRIRRGLAGWGSKYRYCNPPLVLILELDQGLAKVSQIYPGEDFLSAEDVSLPGLGFAQPWNIYSLSLDDLETYRGEAIETLAAVLEMSQGTFAELEETSPLFWFRNLELELGSFFAGQGLSRLLGKHEQTDQAPKPLLLSAVTRQALGRALENKIQAVRPLDDQPALLQLALHAREDAAHGLAASSHRTQSLNYALLDPIGVEIRQASITFSSVHYAEGVLVLGGRINADFARTMEVFAWWDAQERMVYAEVADISDDGQHFNLRFAGLSEREFHVGRLVALLSGRE